MKAQLHVAPDRNHKLKASEKILWDLKDLMQQQYGKNMLVNALPHFKRPDIIYCFDQNGDSVTEEIFDCFPGDFSGEILSKDYLLSQKEEFNAKQDQFEMVAVILGYPNFYIRGRNQPVGELRMKIEQLEMIGYKTAVIKFEKFFNSRPQQRKQLIHDELHKVLKVNDNVTSERMIS